MLTSLRSLPRAVWLLGLVSLINDASSEMLYPLIPLYLSSVLMAGPRALGIIEGIAEATASLLKLFSGVIVDRTRRAKPWVVFGYALAGLARPVTAFAGSWLMVLGIRVADRIGKGLRASPRDAMLAAYAGPDRRGLAFGLHRAMDNAGNLIGPLIAWLLLGAGVGLRDIFLWSIVPSIVCVALTLLVAEPPAEQHARPAPFDWAVWNLPLAMRRYLLVVALFTLGNSSNMFLLLRARELGLSQAQVPLLWATVAGVAMLFSTPLSALSDRVGRIRLLVSGYVAYALFYAALGTFAPGGAMLFALFACYGVFMAATEGVERAMVADLAPEARRGTAFGWFNLTTGACLLPASVIFGELYEHVAPRGAFAFSAACALGAAVLMATWVPVSPRTNAPAR